MRRPKILTIDEELRLLDWTHRNRNFRDFCVVLTILRTGLSVAELRELRVAHLKPSVETFTHLHIGRRCRSGHGLGALPLSRADRFPRLYVPLL